MKRFLIFIISCVGLAIVCPFKLIGQAGTAPPGIQFVMVAFNQPPSGVTVQKAPLRYNKKFALSFHLDDGIADVFTVGFPFFTGINGNGTSYPGLFYTDGCGNDISFKLSSALFSYSSFNNEDMHQPGNNYGAVTWPQLDLMYRNGCGVYNHGFNSDAFTNPEFMSYSIRRNQSFIRRRLLNTTPGGVKTRVFVNPNGATDYTPAAFTQGYRYAFRMGAWHVIPDNGVNVNAISNWNDNLELNRVLAESVDVKQLADQLATNSTGGVNKWMPVFTHRIIEDYPQNTFFSDFNYIASTYGKNGLDNIWMTTEEEILNYLLIRDATTVNHIVSGNTLLITFTGQIPDDLRFYPLSLSIQADATITGITINGGNGNTFTGVGQNQALINLQWNGAAAPNLLELADSQVAIAEQSPTTYNGLVAMDYVLMLPVGPEREALRNRLCTLLGIQYEPGFCATCEVNIGPDITLCQGSCVTLTVPEAAGNAYLWSTDETTASITVCPAQNTQIFVRLTTADQCVANDTLLITVLPSPVFDLGPDRNGCPGETILIQGPEGAGFSYQWFINGQLLPNTAASLQLVLSDTSLIKLTVTGSNTCKYSDSLWVNVWDKPLVQIQASSDQLCVGQAITLNAAAQFAESLLWWNGETTTSVQYTGTTPGTEKAWVRATNGFGCQSSDTTLLLVGAIPSISLQTPQGITGLCAGNTIRVTVTNTSAAILNRVVWNDTDTVSVGSQQTVFKDFTLNQTTTIKAKGLTSIGCSDTKTISITVSPQPQITISAPNEICIGESAQLTASGGLQCIWTNNGNVVGSTHSITVNPQQTSWYRATVTGPSPLFCSRSDSVRIIVNPLPVVGIQASANTVCSGSPVLLTASGAATYQWMNGQQTAQITVKPIINTRYTVTGYSDKGCSDTTSVFITALAVTQPQITGLLPVYCQNDPQAVLVGVPSGGIFAGNGINGSVFHPASAGSGGHLITYTFTNTDGCTGVDSLITKVLSIVQSIEIGQDTAICPHQAIVLDAGQGFASYLWSTGETSQQVTLQGSAFLPGTSRTVQVVGLLNGCSASGSMVLTIRDDCYIQLDEKDMNSLLTIHPNPASNNLFLKLNNNSGVYDLSIFDASGKQVYVMNAIIFVPDVPQNIDISSMPNGTYLVLLKNGMHYFRRIMLIKK